MTEETEACSVERFLLSHFFLTSLCSQHWRHWVNELEGVCLSHWLLLGQKTQVRTKHRSVPDLRCDSDKYTGFGENFSCCLIYFTDISFNTNSREDEKHGITEGRVPLHGSRLRGSASLPGWALHLITAVCLSHRVTFLAIPQEISSHFSQEILSQTSWRVGRGVRPDMRETKSLATR